MVSSREQDGRGRYMLKKMERKIRSHRRAFLQARLFQQGTNKRPATNAADDESSDKKWFRLHEASNPDALIEKILDPLDRSFGKLDEEYHLQRDTENIGKVENSFPQRTPIR